MKSQDIVATLKRDVLTGKLARNQRLQARQGLCERFGASPVTVQRAVDQLVLEGVLITVARHGTFVAAMPPCISQVALIFPYRVFSVVSLFWDALSGSAAELESEGMRFIRYHQIAGNERVEGYRSLLSQIEAGALAGLIFVHPPGGLVGTELLSADIPRVTIMRAGGNASGVPAVCYDAEAFIKRALDRLLMSGMKRVAMLNPSVRNVEYLDQQTALMAERGITTRPSWLMGSDTAFPHWTFNQVRSLVEDRPRGTWPDALVITDDNLVKPAVDGLLTAGIRIPEDIRVIAHCNYPALPCRSANVTWLGFDSRTLLKLCLDSLERQRMGQVPPPSFTVMPVFADEQAQG